LIDKIEKGNVTGAVAATNHHLNAIEDRLIKASPEKLAIDCRSLFAAAE
jgi:DNA-binding GntR family transcriptional regulator